MSDASSFDRLIVAARNHESAAQQQIFDRFVLRLIGLCHSRLDRLTRQKVDPEDIVQSAWRSFLGRVGHDDGLSLDDWNSLWKLLATIAVRKCGDHTKFYRAARRNVAAERSLGNVASGTELTEINWEPVGREASPENEAMLVEAIEGLLNEIDEHGRLVLAMTLQGLSLMEISQQLGRSERTVRRRLDETRARLRLMIEDTE